MCPWKSNFGICSIGKINLQVVFIGCKWQSLGRVIVHEEILYEEEPPTSEGMNISWKTVSGGKNSQWMRRKMWGGKHGRNKFLWIHHFPQYQHLFEIRRRKRTLEWSDIETGEKGKGRRKKRMTCLCFLFFVVLSSNLLVSKLN